MKKKKQQYIQQWICPQRDQIQLVDVRNPICGLCGKIHKIGYFVPGATKEYYKDQDWWYLSTYFDPDPRGREN